MSKDPSSLIQSYKRRQQTGPFILWSIVGLLILAGVVLLIVWLAKPNSPIMALFASQTPTATVTASATSTATLTETPTETPTATITLSPTPSAPFNYTVQEGDSLFLISGKFKLGDNGIALILYLNPYNPDPKAANPGIDPATQQVFVGQVIKVPNPGMPLPTPTPIPSNIARGTVLMYTIEPGDNLVAIASKFNSTAEDIQKINNIADPNKIQVGQQIKVRVNIVTPTPTRAATITAGPSPTPPSPYTETPPGGLTLTPTVTATP